MKRILIYGCLGILVAVGLISTTVFVVLYVNSQNDVKIKDAELALCKTNTETYAKNCDAAISTDTSTTDTSSTTKPTVVTEAETQFIDNGFGIKVTYPTSWKGELNTKVSDEFAFEPTYGKVISSYEFELTKASSQLKFDKILAGIDGGVVGLKPSTHEWRVIPGTKVVRFKAKDSGVWTYASTFDCKEASLVYFDEATAATFDVCAGSFFPGFGNSGAASVTLKSTDSSSVLEEADLIVKSALK